MRRSTVLLLAPVVLAGVLAAPAASGDGIRMRAIRAVCDPACPGDRSPAWSPGSKTIAFVRRTPGRSPLAIFTVPSGGGPVRRVTRPDRSALPDEVSWSPDGRRLAFHSMAGVNYVVPAGGGKPVRLRARSTTGPVFEDLPARWAPDGRRLAFVRHAPFSRYGPTPWCCQLWIAPADGSAATLFGGGPPPAPWLAEPAWSPDGRLAYVTGPRLPDGRPDLRRAEIWAASPDGGRRRLVAGNSSDGGPSGLAWSADGSRLAYVMEHEDGLGAHWVSSDGVTRGTIGLVARDPTRPWAVRCCAFAPDARRAVSLALGADGAMEVRLLRFPAGPRRLADGLSSQSQPWLTTASWSPDGRRIAYVGDGECPTELAVHTVRVDTGVVRRVTRPCRIAGRSGPDRLRGMPGTDALYGGRGNDRLEALAGHDLLQGGPGRDLLLGGRGDDRLYGGPGWDRIVGGAGWDALYSRDGAVDVVRCGSGRDTVRADRRDRVARNCEHVERE